MHVWWKRKENSFSLQGEEEGLSLRINVQKNWLRDHTSWALCGIGMKIKGILKSCFWISLHQGTPSCSLFLKLRNSMLSHMNEVDPCVAFAMGFVWDEKLVFPTIGIKANFISYLCNMLIGF